MLRSLIVVAALAATPASATEWIHCNDSDGAASFDFLTGAGMGVLSIAGMTISVGEKVWASDVAYGPGEPAAVGQAFEDADSIRIDAMDGDFTKFAELRLFKADNSGTPIYAGTLTIKDDGAWAVSCEGP
jgi:hypothetical protein